MYGVWQTLFPGFSRSFGGFSVGPVEMVVYGFLAAVIFVPVYSRLRERELGRRKPQGTWSSSDFQVGQTPRSACPTASASALSGPEASYLSLS